MGAHPRRLGRAAEHRGMYVWLLLFGVVLWLGSVLWYVRQPFASAYHPITYFLIYHGVLFAIRPVLAWWWRFDFLYVAYQFTPTMAEKATVLAATDLSLLVFMAACAWSGHVPFSRAPASDRGEPPRLSLSFWLMCAACLPIALQSLASSLTRATTSVNTMVLDAATGFTVNTTSNGYFTDSILMLGPIATLFAWAGRFRLWSLAPLTAFILAKAGTGGRWPFVMAAISAALLYLYERRRRWPPARVLLFAAPLIALFTITSLDRGAGIRQLFGTTPASSTDYFHERPLESMDYGNLEFTEYLVHVIPYRTGRYDYFLDNLQVLTEPIPRVLWPGKPIGSPIRPILLMKYGYPIGMTNSVAGEGWKEAGWLGVIIWSALFGLFYGTVYTRYVRSAQDRYQTALYMIFVPISLACFRDGLLLTVCRTLLFTLLPVLVWHWCARLTGSSALRAGHAFSP